MAKNELFKTAGGFLYLSASHCCFGGWDGWGDVRFSRSECPRTNPPSVPMKVMYVASRRWNQWSRFPITKRPTAKLVVLPWKNAKILLMLIRLPSSEPGMASRNAIDRMQGMWWNPESQKNLSQCRVPCEDRGYEEFPWGASFSRPPALHGHETLRTGYAAPGCGTDPWLVSQHCG